MSDLSTAILFHTKNHDGSPLSGHRAVRSQPSSLQGTPYRSESESRPNSARKQWDDGEVCYV